MCYNVCLLPPPPQMRQCIIVSDCFHCFVFKLPAQIWVLYQMWKFASQQIPEGCAAMCMWDVATSSVCPHFSLFFATLLQTHLYRAAWVSVMNNFFHTYFLYMLEFFLTLSFIPLTHKTSFSNLTAWWVKDEATWRIVWKAQCDTSFYGILHLGLIPASCLLTSKHASVRVRVLVFCWSQGYHFLLLQSVPSPMAKF